MKTLQSSFPREGYTPFKKNKKTVTIFKNCQRGRFITRTQKHGELVGRSPSKNILLDAKTALREEKEQKELLDEAVAQKVKLGYVRLPLKNNGKVYFVQPRDAKGHFAKRVELGAM